MASPPSRLTISNKPNSNTTRSSISTGAKRTLDEWYEPTVSTYEDAGAVVTSTTTSSSSSPHSNKRQRLLFSQSLLVESLQSTLEHERSMRAMDQERFQQAKRRLEQQVAFSTQQAQQEATNASKVQRQAETATAQLEASRNKAMQQVRHLQMELLSSSERENEISALEHECERLRQQLQARTQTETHWKRQVEELQRVVQEASQMQKAAPEPTTASATTTPSPTTADATTTSPSSRELLQVRIQLAEAERRTRQLERQHQQDLERQKAHSRESEKASLVQSQLQTLQAQFKTLATQHEQAAAVNKAWKEFALGLEKQLQESGVLSRLKQNNDSEQQQGDFLKNTPPEVSTVLRYLTRAESQTSELKHECRRLEQECERLGALATQTQQELATSRQQADDLRLQCERLKDQWQQADKQLATLQAQESIAKRENDSLRELIKTFNDMPPGAVPMQQQLQDPSSSTSSLLSLLDYKTLQVSLTSVQEQLDVAKRDRDGLSQDLEASQRAQLDAQQEIQTIRTKFGLLRQALEKERAKVLEAEERANSAQAMAGKGFFSAEKTQVLHLKENPLVQALKEEISVLQRQLQAAKSSSGGDRRSSVSSSSASASKHAPDPEKMNQRLKENFKEQIALFREGVYLMTGLKIDMLPGMPDRPTFRVRSVFAEQEQDALMLQWPTSINTNKTSNNNNDDEPVSSLDILTTEFAQVLSKTPSYAYMTKFQSLPAFLASVQLSLFEKQTVMM